MLITSQQKSRRITSVRFALSVAAVSASFWLIAKAVHADGWFNNGTPPTKAPNIPYEVAPAEGEPVNKSVGGIMTTRHNLTQAYSQTAWSRPAGGLGSIMNPYRNDYFEVCVYCHTPHGANSTVGAPIWNRTIKQNAFTLYKNTASITELNKTQPGPNSLTCLSCHDGATAIDSIINMPTRLNGTMRAGYSQAQETDDSNTFLGAWSGVGANSGNTLGLSGPADPTLAVPGTSTSTHFAMGECQACHNLESEESNTLPIPSFQLFNIGARYTSEPDLDQTNTANMGNLDYIAQYRAGLTSSYYLGDDHPIGVRYPDKFGPGSDYREPTVKTARIAFFDRNSNQHADPDEVRLYNTGDGYEVECGSCHDPHGVPALTNAGNVDKRNVLTPTFLRVGRLTGSTVSGTTVSANYGGELCLTCHVK